MPALRPPLPTRAERSDGPPRQPPAATPAASRGAISHQTITRHHAAAHRGSRHARAVILESARRIPVDLTNMVSKLWVFQLRGQ